jgi:arsenite methyltransferase
MHQMHAEVQRYYGEVLKSSADLKTDACCTADEMPAYAKAVLAEIHDEVLTRYYGCGLVLPEALDGARILDLGCGAGRDCYVLSRLVGPDGQVVGVDMTAEQIEVARRHVEYHTARFGYARSNVTFIDGNIEQLDQTDLDDSSFDLVVSNCVINLATDKRAVLQQAFRLLKPGGEVYFSDIYADRRVPENLKTDPVLYGECLSGALYWNDFLQLAKETGFTDPRLVTDQPVAVEDPGLMKKLGDIRFYSATYRLFKLPVLESAGEDYGQAVCYGGNAAHHPDQLVLDKHHIFPAGETVPVSGNTWRMLKETRLAPFFEFFGDGAAHTGIFEDGGRALPFDHHEPGPAGDPKAGSCC